MEQPLRARRRPSIRRQLAVGLGACVVALSLAPPAAAQQVDPQVETSAVTATRAVRGGVPAEVLAATNFLYVVYPDLVGRPLTLTINPAGGRVAISVADTVDALAAKDRPAPEPLLTAEIVFTKTGTLASYAAQGALVERTRNEAFAQTLHAHPGWTESDAEVALLEIGGRPRTASTPLGSLDRAKLAQFVGAVTAEASSLRLRSVDDAGSAGPVVAPGWITAVQTTAADGTITRYRMVFEPFGGRLVLVTRE